MENKQIKRDIEKNIRDWLFKGKIIILYGARQVGKTTLAKKLLREHGRPTDYFNCEISSIRSALEKEDPTALKKFLGDGRLIVLDEAQKVSNIGLILKLLLDTYPNIQIVATGSSSFDLANQVNEPLTGRALEFTLYPFSLRELKNFYKNYELEGQLENLLIYGLYPEIVKSDSTNARQLLDNLSNKYLYQDILIFNRIKKSGLIVKLLQLLALQIGNEVSINELAVNLQCSRDTVVNYLDILEKAFIIFRLRAYSRNQRKEIVKKQKIYFVDLGIRNSLISRYNELAVRDDVGALWENFCIIERLKKIQADNLYCQKYFWRAISQKKVDYVEEYNDRLDGYEFKWGKGKASAPKEFLAYKNSRVNLINRDNYQEFLT
ncbi:MAG: ATP-binding protein [Candidatus Falkowbacteria bacterium]|nr:ATP-binding protein [Candidatus Falkowbacteria bacterium]